MKVFLILIFLFTYNIWAKTSLNLTIELDEIQQGEIVDAKIRATQDGSLNLNNFFKNEKIAKTLYFISISEPIDHYGRRAAKLVFLKVPETNSISDNLKGEEVSVSWNSLSIIPTEVSQSFVWGDFSIPGRKNLFIEVLIALGILVCLVFIVWLTKKILRKKSERRRKDLIKKEIMSCDCYEEIVNLWKNKSKYLAEFPRIESHFKKLETTLFKYQFKMNRSPQEVKEVISAYEVFKNEVSGDLNGI